MSHQLLLNVTITPNTFFFNAALLGPFIPAFSCNPTCPHAVWCMRYVDQAANISHRIRRTGIRTCPLLRPLLLVVLALFVKK